MNSRFGYSDKIPENLREPFCKLSCHVVNIKQKIILYDQLYMTDENVKILNNASPTPFKLIKESLATDIMMSIFRLLDPEKSCGKENLSVAFLKNGFSMCSIQGLNEIFEKLMSLKKQVEPYRHKILAHNDLKKVVSPATATKTNFPWNTLQEIINLLCASLNLIYQNFVNAEMIFIPKQRSSGRALIALLKKLKEA
ncbi:MAG: hypothetical protein PF690_11815 [Deltaproteobacteria bacterium]|jgi:hypothetical protein|nr:hypothetical protein [Deltaproteobacteria bacterium]